MTTSNMSAQPLPPTPPGTAVRLILCRHGETALNARRVLQGRGVDPPLNDIGILQAQRLATRLSLNSVDWIISSHLQRAVQTADLIAHHHPLNIVRNTYEDLAEISWGELEGTQSPNLSSLHHAWDTGDFNAAAKGGETPNFVAQRATKLIVNIILQALELPVTNGRIPVVVIVIHGRLLRILLSSLLHRSLWFMSSMAHANANLNIVDVVHHAHMSQLLASQSLPRLIDLTPAELSEFALNHLNAQLLLSSNGNSSTLPNNLSAVITPKSLDCIGQLDQSHARVFDLSMGSLCAHWPSSVVSTLQEGLVGFMDVRTGGEDSEYESTWWLVGSAVNDVLHLDGLSSTLI